MLRKKKFIWQVFWFYVSWIFVERSRNVRIDRLVIWKVDAIVDFFDFDTIILSSIFECDLLVCDCSYICSFLC